MTASVLLVEAPSPFRNALLSALQERGSQVEVCDDAMDALARVDDLAPEVIAISDSGSAEHALDSTSLCRLLERRAQRARIYRLGDISGHSALPSRAAFVPRFAGAQAIATTLLSATTPEPQGFHTEVGPAQLGQLLLWLGEQRASGVLTLSAEGQERDIAIVRGIPVHSSATLANERLGAIALKQSSITESQLDAALAHARAQSLRLGQALVQLGAIDASALFRLRARQTLEQLETACAGGPYKARFKSNDSVADALDLFPVHPMTVLLGAAYRLPVAIVSTALDRGAGRAIAEVSTTGLVSRWLKAIGASFDAEASSLGELRTSLAADLHPSTGKADAIVLALIAAGAVRLGEAQRTSHAGAPPSLPPPVGASVSLLRALDVRAPFRAPVSEAWPIAPANHELQRTIDDALLGAPLPASPVNALSAVSASIDRKEHALHGPEHELLTSALQALYVQRKTAGSPFEVLGVSIGSSRASVDLAYYEQLSALDRACQADPETASTPSIRLRKLELRRAFDRAHAVLCSALPVSATAPAEQAEPGEASKAQRASAASVTVTRTAPVAELEPLLRQARWHDIATLIEQKHPGGTGMPPGTALIYAIALKEAPPTPARAAQLAQADRMGVRATADLLGVSEDSATALVVAKRTLRKRQLEWQKEPPPRVSIMLMLAALAVGAGVGLALSHQFVFWPF